MGTIRGTLRTTAATAVAAIVLAGCSGDDDTPTAVESNGGEAAETPPDEAGDDASQDDEPDGTTIPPGTYRKIILADAALAELVALGVSEAMASQVVVDELESDEIHVTFRIDEDRWVQMMTWRGNHDDVGARGTHTYDGEGRWVRTERTLPGRAVRRVCEHVDVRGQRAHPRSGQ